VRVGTRLAGEAESPITDREMIPRGVEDVVSRTVVAVRLDCDHGSDSLVERYEIGHPVHSIRVWRRREGELHGGIALLHGDRLDGNLGQVVGIVHLERRTVPASNVGYRHVEADEDPRWTHVLRGE